ncbi:hypothetical protein [Burkholderia cepacia]|nr:hypothetical protein [Burkholderia cepacia]
MRSPASVLTGFRNPESGQVIRAFIATRWFGYGNHRKCSVLPARPS